MTQIHFKAYFIMLLFWLFGIGNVFGQSYLEDVPEAVLPSVETSYDLGQLPSDESSVRPGLRYGPSEGGDANKEIWLPVGDLDGYIVFFLILSVFVYFFITKHRGIYEK